MVLHLAWHKNLRVEAMPDKWVAVVPSFNDELTTQIAAIIPTLGERYEKDKNGGIDYGINLYVGANAFDKDLNYSVPEGHDGLTCATFVAKIFSALKTNLVDLTTWKQTPENKIWGDAIVCLLQATSSAAEHVERVKNSNLGYRLRPEEVAAASEQYVEKNPATFDQVQTRAAEMVRELNAVFPPESPMKAESEIGKCVFVYHSSLAALTTKDQAKEPAKIVQVAPNVDGANSALHVKADGISSQAGDILNKPQDGQ